MSLKEEILALADQAFEDVPVPQWGRTVRVGSMTAADRDDWEMEAYLERKATNSAPKNVRARLVARCVIDEAGERVFKDADIEALGRKNAKALDVLYDAAIRVNGIEQKEQKAIEGN